MAAELGYVLFMLVELSLQVENCLLGGRMGLSSAGQFHLPALAERLGQLAFNSLIRRGIARNWGCFSIYSGVLAASRILGVSVSSGGGVGGGALLLESIAAAVIGGVSLFGGRGQVVAALFGALIIGTVSNGLNLMGVQNEIRLIVTGILLILAISIDRGIEQLSGSPN